MKLALTLLLISLPLSLSHAGPAGRAEPLGWLNWDQGMSEASITRRPILVDVYTEWCGWCKRMDRDVYARDDVRDYLNHHFIVVRLDAESMEEARFGDRTFTARALAQQLRVSGYPTTIFLRSNGEHIANVPGYVPADRFLRMLRYIGEDHIGRGVSWEEYEKSTAAGRIHP
ncbi:MAG TPA: thioredoxin fold domain-containing protein [Candidatus Eisenbacteria bacterium]|jgi:thioredoxin-related protein